MTGTRQHPHWSVTCPVAISGWVGQGPPAAGANHPICHILPPVQALGWVMQTRWVQYNQAGALGTKIGLCSRGWVWSRAAEPVRRAGEGSQWRNRLGVRSAMASPPPIGPAPSLSPSFSGQRWVMLAWPPSTSSACKEADLWPLGSPPFPLALGLSFGSTPLQLRAYISLKLTYQSVLWEQ